MSPTPCLSQAALAAGLPARFLYWSGRSGRRYLFTGMGASEAADLESGVAIAVSDERIVWVGEVEDLAALPHGATARRAEIYVHLLAATLAERRGVIWDLRPTQTEAEPAVYSLAA